MKGCDRDASEESASSKRCGIKTKTNWFMKIALKRSDNKTTAFVFD
jgi:hypothetical protein